MQYSNQLFLYIYLLINYNYATVAAKRVVHLHRAILVASPSPPFVHVSNATPIMTTSSPISAPPSSTPCFISTTPSPSSIIYITPAGTVIFPALRGCWIIAHAFMHSMLQRRSRSTSRRPWLCITSR